MEILLYISFNSPTDGKYQSPLFVPRILYTAAETAALQPRKTPL